MVGRFLKREEYQSIADSFGLGEIKGLEKFKSGLAAPKVSIGTERGKYVIAKYTLGHGDNFRNKTREALREEILLLNTLVNLPVPQYVSHKNSGFILDYNGYGITVYHYLIGKNKNILNKNQALALGEFLGSFHKQGVRLKDWFTARHEFYNFPPEKFAQMKSYVYEQTNEKLKSVIKEVEREIVRTRPRTNLPHGPIHVDIRSENILFKENELTGVVDFGNFYVGPLMLDIGKTIIFNCAVGGNIDQTLVRTFLKGYESYRPLGNNESRYLRDSILYGIYSHVWLDLYHVPLKLVPEKHTLYFVETFLPVARKIAKSKDLY